MGPQHDGNSPLFPTNAAYDRRHPVFVFRYNAVPSGQAYL